MEREIELECPSCSPTSTVLHEVLRDRDKQTVRCTKCSTTRQIQRGRSAAPVTLRVVVSYHDKSYTRFFEVGGEEPLRIGDEIIVENESAEAVRITAIESPHGIRHIQAPAALVKTLWAEKIDKVVVKIAVHSGRTTRSYDVPVEGDREYVVGGREQRGEVSRIKIKKGPVLEREGQAAQAKDIQRIYVKAKRRERGA